MSESKKQNPFKSSLSNYINSSTSRGQLADYLTAIDPVIDSATAHLRTATESHELDTAFQKLLRAYTMHTVREDISYSFGIAMHECESPIEGLILAAFCMIMLDHGCRIQFRMLSSTWDFWPAPNYPVITIIPQAVIGDFRVDFLLEYEDTIPDFNNEVESRNGLRIPGSKTVKSRLVVECDGHEFHERTKDQARKDKKRDRTLQSTGYPVFRFTGSEIWKDSFPCAMETFNKLREVSEGF